MARKRAAVRKEAPAMEGSATPPPEKDAPRGVLGYIRSIAPAVLVALGIRAFLFEPFSIPSGSMLPTLDIGDYVVVSKWAYGVRMPFTNDMLWQARDPQRGDVIVFEKPFEPREALIKRVVGLPGDVVTLKDGVVSVNGTPQPRKLLDEAFAFEDHDEASGRWMERHGSLFEEKLERRDGGVHPHLLLQTNPSEPDEGPFRVPPGEVMVMGDNRDNSADSRVGNWYVPFGNIRGRADVIGFSAGNGRLRMDRFLRGIDAGVPEGG
jgi:signal peptidase I